MLVNAPGKQHVMAQASGSLPSTGETGIEFRLLASTCPARVVAAIWELWICRWNISLSPCFVTLPFKSMNKQCSKGCFKQYFSKQNKLYNVSPKFSPNGMFQITGASQPLRAAIRPGSLSKLFTTFLTTLFCWYLSQSTHRNGFPGCGIISHMHILAIKSMRCSLTLSPHFPLFSNMYNTCSKKVPGLRCAWC